MDSILTGAVAEKRPVLGYLTAILLCLIALPVAQWIDAPSSCFLLAVMGASLIGGRKVGLFACLIAFLLFDLLFLSPRLHLFHSGGSVLRLTTFSIAVLLASELIQMVRRSERNRIKSEADFRALVQTCPDAVLLLDEELRIVVTNPAALTMFGHNESELHRQSISSLLPDLTFDTPPKGEFRAFHANSNRFYVEATCGRLGARTSLFLRDITERKKMLTALHESEENLRLIIETIPSLVFIRDAEGRLEAVNHRVTDFTGAPLEELLQEEGLGIVHPDDRGRVRELIRHYSQTGEPFQYEFRQRTAEGGYRWVHSSAQPLKDKEGKTLRWYGLLTDIEDRKAMEESLRGTERQLAEAARTSTITEMTAAVVHEISQPLSAMVTNGQACLRYMAAKPMNLAAATLAAERIVRDGKDAAQTIRSIRALFRRADPEKAPLDLCQVVKEVMLLFEAEARRLQIRLQEEVDPLLSPVKADKLQVQQVLVNLVSNALEAVGACNGPVREVRIRCSETETEVLTEVVDCGPGLEDPEKVFETFFTTKESGMGMGLPISKTIIESHDGRLWAESRPGDGAVFRFTLPVSVKGEKAA